jgi:hypothetical protein
MSRWTAKCWLGSEVGYQNCEVDANTINGAKKQLQQIYGAEQIINLREVRSGSSSSSSSLGGLVSFLFFIFIIGLIIEYWFIAIPILLILGVIMIYGMS